MSLVHIATSDSFLVDAVECETTCPLCGVSGKNLLGWNGMRCLECRHDWFLDMAWPDIVRTQRQILRLSRREMGEITGYSPKTIKRYEWVRCSKPYLAAALRVFQERRA